MRATLPFCAAMFCPRQTFPCGQGNGARDDGPRPPHLGGSDVDYDVMFEKMSGKDGQLDLAELQVAVQVRSDVNGVASGEIQ